MKRSLIVFSLLCLGGCQTIGGWADSAGEYLPVIGERCEHWQCMTENGQEISEAEKTRQQEEAKKQQAAPKPDSSAASGPETTTKTP